MRHRFLMLSSVVAVLLVGLSMFAAVPVIAQSQPDNWTPPRTPWGAPNLQGVWDFRTITPMERPTGFEDIDVLTDQEVTEFEAASEAQRAALDVETPFDTVGNYNQFWFDAGTAVVDTKRTGGVSLVRKRAEASGDTRQRQGALLKTWDLVVCRSVASWVLIQVHR